MTIYRLAQDLEIKFWNAIIPAMQKEGSLMKTIRTAKRFSQNKAVNIILLIIIWAAIGFVSGMIVGRVIWLFQIL
jgi:hypothetical protein